MNKRDIVTDVKQGGKGVKGIAIVIDIERCKWYARGDEKCSRRG